MRSPKIQLAPELAWTTSAACARSRPSSDAIAMASHPAARLAAASMLFTIFMREPSPALRLMRKHFEAMASITAALRSKAASLPDAIMLRVPERDRAGPPEIGASSISMPRAASAAANRSLSDGAIVLHIMKVGARPACSSMTDCVCAASTTTLTRISTSPASGLAFAPIASRSRWAAMSRTKTGKPLPSRVFAIPMPIAPTPMTATRGNITAAGAGAGRTRGGA